MAPATTYVWMVPVVHTADSGERKTAVMIVRGQPSACSARHVARTMASVRELVDPHVGGPKKVEEEG